MPNHWSAWGIAVALFSLGFLSSGQVVSFVANIEHNPRWASGTSIAVTNLFVMFIGGAFQPVVGFVLDWLHPEVLKGNEQVYLSSDFRVAMLVLPIATIIGLVLACFMKESYSIREEAFEALTDADSYELS